MSRKSLAYGLYFIDISPLSLLMNHLMLRGAEGREPSVPKDPKESNACGGTHPQRMVHVILGKRLNLSVHQDLHL